MGVPRGNGQVERINRIIIPLFAKLSAPRPEEWFKHVDRVQQYLNATPTRSTGFSPFELLIGKPMRLRDDLELRKLIEDDVVKELQEKRLILREQAKQAIEKIQRENKRNFDRKRKETVGYKVGELVAIKRTQVAPGSKFCSKFLGPYEIARVLRGDRFIVTKIGEHEGPRTTSTYAENMKKWISADYVDPDCSDDDCDGSNDGGSRSSASGADV